MTSESGYYQLPSDCIIYPGSLDPRDGVCKQWFCVMDANGNYEIRMGDSSPELRPELGTHVRPDDLSDYALREVIWDSEPVDFDAVADAGFGCFCAEECVPRVWGGLPVSIAELHYDNPHVVSSVSTRMSESMREIMSRGRAAPQFDSMLMMQPYLPE